MKVPVPNILLIAVDTLRADHVGCWEQQVELEKEPAFAVVVDYLRAFEAHDISRCLEFYADDARLLWMTSTLKTKREIEQWHQWRFAATVQPADG